MKVVSGLGGGIGEGGRKREMGEKEKERKDGKGKKGKGYLWNLELFLDCLWLDQLIVQLSIVE